MSEVNRKKRQYLIAAVLGAIILGLFFGLNALLDPGPGFVAASRPVSTFDETILADRTSAASPEMSWITQSRREIDRLTQLIEEQVKTSEERDRVHRKNLEDLRKDYDEVLTQQVEEIGKLQEQLDKGVGPRPGAIGTAPLDPNAPAQTVPVPDAGFGTEFIRQNNSRRETPSGRPRPDEGHTDDSANPPTLGVTFELSDVAEQPSDVRSLRDYIPAGSYAPAVVLSGADATTNVSARENPLPVMFRITGPAVTAGFRHGRPATIDISGCTVQGSATGDLSSERVYVRLISMTCLTDRKGGLIEVDVAGYMVGSGKAGVRGNVVSREGGLVTNAAIAGALSGLGSAASAAGNTGTSSESATSGNLLGQVGATVAGNGLSTAAKTLSDYYVQRAEQYQPVVSLYGGTRVELVFLKGIELK